MVTLDHNETRQNDMPGNIETTPRGGETALKPAESRSNEQLLPNDTLNRTADGLAARILPFQRWKTGPYQYKHVEAEVCTVHKDDKEHRPRNNDKQQLKTAKIP